MKTEQRDEFEMLGVFKGVGNESHYGAVWKKPCWFVVLLWLLCAADCFVVIPHPSLLVVAPLLSMWQSSNMASNNSGGH